MNTYVAHIATILSEHFQSTLVWSHKCRTMDIEHCLYIFNKFWDIQLNKKLIFMRHYSYLVIEIKNHRKHPTSLINKQNKIL